MKIPILDPKALKDNCEPLPVGALGAVAAGGYLNRSFPVAWLKGADLGWPWNQGPDTRLAALLDHQARVEIKTLIGLFVQDPCVPPAWSWHYEGEWRKANWDQGQSLWVDLTHLVGWTLGTAPDTTPTRKLTNGEALILEVLKQAVPLLNEKPNIEPVRRIGRKRKGA